MKTVYVVPSRKTPILSDLIHNYEAADTLPDKLFILINNVSM